MRCIASLQNGSIQTNILTKASSWRGEIPIFGCAPFSEEPFPTGAITGRDSQWRNRERTQVSPVDPYAKSQKSFFLATTRCDCRHPLVSKVYKRIFFGPAIR